MTRTAAVALAACLALSGCTAHPAPRPPQPAASVRTTTSTRAPAMRQTVKTSLPPAPRCDASQLRISPGVRPSPRTHEARQRYELSDISRSTCVLRGYPDVTLFDTGGRRLPFTFRHRADPSIGDAPPATIRIRPGRSAHFEIYRSACVASEGMPVARIMIRLPAGRELGPVEVGRRALPIGYCPDDPGGREPVSVSPVEPG